MSEHAVPSHLLARPIESRQAESAGKVAQAATGHGNPNHALCLAFRMCPCRVGAEETDLVVIQQPAASSEQLPVISHQPSAWHPARMTVDHDDDGGVGQLPVDDHPLSFADTPSGSRRTGLTHSYRIEFDVVALA